MRVEASNPAFVLALRRESAPPPAPVAPVAGPDVRVDIAVPSAPPVEVVEAVQRAADVANELAMRSRELHFSQDKASGRIIVQVRDLQGHVIRTIPPSTALETLAPGAWR